MQTIHWSFSIHRCVTRLFFWLTLFLSAKEASGQCDPLITPHLFDPSSTGIFCKGETIPIGVSISDTDGIAAKATTQQAFVIGQAQQSFDGSSGAISGSGSSAIGRVNVNILVQRNPNLKDNVAVPSFLRSAGDSIAGKEVTPVRIYAALGVFIVAAAVAFGALTSGIRSAMISIGRNPLSRHFILNGLVQVTGVAVLILTMGMIGVYLLLKL